MAPRFKPVAILPTLCTLGNTFCGFLAIAKTADALLFPARFVDNVIFAAWMILLAMVFDALDGRIARMTKQTTDFGAQLDSLTDLITFGVAPAFLVKVVYEHAMVGAGLPYQQKFTLLLTVIYVMCAALRLARFTLETEPQPEAHERFLGLPSPAAAGVVASAVFLLFEKEAPLADTDPRSRVLLFKAFLWLPLVLGLLMVSHVEYIHLVSRWFRGRKSFWHLVFVLTILLLAVIWHHTVFFVLFAGYAVASPAMAIIERVSGRRILVPEGDDDDESAGRRPAPFHPALVALGSNLGDREEHLRFAVGALRALSDTKLVAVSPFVETEPEGGPAQRPFLNGAALLETRLAPSELLRHLQRIEQARGREHTVRHGPRTLDLDLILHGNTICETADLVLPHPRFRERGFVLEPAVAVAPDLRDPVTGRTVRDLAAAAAKRRAET